MGHRQTQIDTDVEQKLAKLKEEFENICVHLQKSVANF